MVESAPLLREYTFAGIEGSNPSGSATLIKPCNPSDYRVFLWGRLGESYTVRSFSVMFYVVRLYSERVDEVSLGRSPDRMKRAKRRGETREAA